jgi:hypothetical protein
MLRDQESAALRDDPETLGAGLGGEIRREFPGFARPAARQRQLGLQEAILELVGHEASPP